MSGDHDRAGFGALTQAGAEDGAARALGGRLKANLQPADLKALAALWLHGAAAAPERIPGIYDAACEGWLGEPLGVPALKMPSVAPEPIPALFWKGLWELLKEPRGGLEAVNLTTKTAGLA